MIKVLFHKSQFFLSPDKDRNVRTYYDTPCIISTSNESFNFGSSATTWTNNYTITSSLRTYLHEILK